MTAGSDPLQRWMDIALKRAPGDERSREPDDIERMVELIEAMSGKIQALDIGEMEAAFAGQAAALNVIFGQFVRAAGRKYFTYDSMRVALRAQAQCRATYKGLIDLKSPRMSAAGRGRAKPVLGSPGEAENSSEQTIEGPESPA